MSADNYGLIRNHPKGGFAALMGFASCDGAPVAEESDPQFDTIDAALASIADDYFEYGISVHAECERTLALQLQNICDRLRSVEVPNDPTDFSLVFGVQAAISALETAAQIARNKGI